MRKPVVKQWSAWSRYCSLEPKAWADERVADRCVDSGKIGVRDGIGYLAGMRQGKACEFLTVLRDDVRQDAVGFGEIPIDSDARVNRQAKRRAGRDDFIRHAPDVI